MFGKMMNSFYYGKSGKGDFRKEDLPKNRWQLFWEMLRVRFSALCRLNLMTIVAWIPLLILLGTCISSVFNVLVVTSDYQTYLSTGAMGNLTQEQIDALAGVNLDELTMNMFYSVFSTFCLWAIPCILITGPVKAGVAYVTRNWARDEHAFVWSDFKDAVKENWKQALGVSAITSVLPIIVYVCYQFYGNMAKDSTVFVVPQMLVLMLALVWTLALVYLYPIMVSYKVNFRTLVKNALIMAIGRLPQTVGIRLVLLVPTVVALVAFYYTGSLIAILVLAGYYVIAGFALSRFVMASYTNAVFDRYINAHMEGVKINRGMASDEDDEDEEEEENASDEPQQ